MGEQMYFEKTWEEFLEKHSFKDKERLYTNGANLIPAFRVEQMVEHYFVNSKEREVDSITIGINVDDKGSIDELIEKLEKIDKLLESINGKVDVKALLTSRPIVVNGGIDFGGE